MPTPVPSPEPPRRPPTNGVIPLPYTRTEVDSTSRAA
jgi:hypothetical protein